MSLIGKESLTTNLTTGTRDDLRAEWSHCFGLSFFRQATLAEVALSSPVEFAVYATNGKSYGYR
jgi:hypothetical protein